MKVLGYIQRAFCVIAKCLLFKLSPKRRIELGKNEVDLGDFGSMFMLEESFGGEFEFRLEQFYSTSYILSGKVLRTSFFGSNFQFGFTFYVHSVLRFYR